MDKEEELAKQILDGSHQNNSEQTSRVDNADHPETPHERSFMKETQSFLGAVFSWLVIPLLIVVAIHLFVFQPYHVVGSSMVPTLHEPDYLIISKIGKTTASIKKLFNANTNSYIPKRGDIIVFHFPKDPKEIFVKRVVGIPGDRVVIKNGEVRVYNSVNPDGFNPDTSYEPADASTLIDNDVTVRANNVFVIGDNRESGKSYDSREWGELPSSYIIGGAVLRLLPLDQIKLLNNDKI